MEVKEVKTAEIKEHPNNPRVHPASEIAKLQKSIGAFGWINPVILAADGTMLAGHARVKAARKAGIKTLPAVQLKLSREKADMYLIADNKLGELSEWDNPKLQQMVKSLLERNIDLAMTGFEQDELETIMEAFEEGYERPVFDTEEISQGIETAKTKEEPTEDYQRGKKEYWLHVTFYGQPELYTELREKLAAAGGLEGPHRMKRNWFSGQVEGHKTREGGK